MNIQIKSTKFDAGQDIIALARLKTEELAKFIGKGSENVQALVELEKTAPTQQSGKIWRTEMNIDWNGERIRVESVSDSIEKSIHKAYSHMAEELKRRKRRESSLYKKGSGALKSILRGFTDR